MRHLSLLLLCLFISPARGTAQTNVLPDEQAALLAGVIQPQAISIVVNTTNTVPTVSLSGCQRARLILGHLTTTTLSTVGAYYLGSGIATTDPTHLGLGSLMIVGEGLRILADGKATTNGLIVHPRGIDIFVSGLFRCEYTPSYLARFLSASIVPCGTLVYNFTNSYVLFGAAIMGTLACSVLDFVFISALSQTLRAPAYGGSQTSPMRGDQ